MFDDFAFVEQFAVSSLYRNGKEHAFKEGEEDRSLEYWREVHKKFFRECLEEYELEFSENMKVVCEEFVVVYQRSGGLNGFVIADGVYDEVIDEELILYEFGYEKLLGGVR